MSVSPSFSRSLPLTHMFTHVDFPDPDLSMEKQRPGGLMYLHLARFSTPFLLNLPFPKGEKPSRQWSSPR